MNKILLLVVFSMVMPVAYSASEKEESIPHPSVLRISAEDLKGMLDAGEEVVVVDTRDSMSYNYGHIQTAVNIYYDPTGDPMGREMILVALPMDKLIVLYCP